MKAAKLLFFGAYSFCPLLGKVTLFAAVDALILTGSGMQDECNLKVQIRVKSKEAFRVKFRILFESD